MRAERGRAGVGVVGGDLGRQEGGGGRGEGGLYISV